jgi:DNA-binding MarR family transcriptional regulator
VGSQEYALTADQDRALSALLGIVLIGMPQLERAVRGHGVLQIEFALIQALAMRAEGWRLSDLAQATNMSQSRLSHRMRKLVDRGYVQPRPSPDDGRATIAVLTPSGRRLLDELKPGYLCQARETLFANLDAEQTRQLADALGTIAEGIGATRLEPGASEPGTGNGSVGSQP